VRACAPRSKDVPLIRRALAEVWLPFALLRGLRSSGVSVESFDGVIWYSPTIFLGLVASRVKRRSSCRGYLIVRDLFPDWAVDAGVMRRGLVYRFFKAVERFQYRVADVIGVQTPANVALVARDARAGAHIEVLHNWLAPPLPIVQPRALELGHVAGRKIFVYTGNMGIAQDLGAFLDLAAGMTDRSDVKFLFVGRGSEAESLQASARQRSLGNVEFMQEIDPASIPALLECCHVGMVALDPRHTTHNIPGKFITYVSNGLPVLARVNRGNDLASVIRESGVGYVVEGDSLPELRQAALRLADDATAREDMAAAGRLLSQRCFTPAAAAEQIVSALLRATR
jgi:glycosyltransferase involved in cell wall biosynthesis